VTRRQLDETVYIVLFVSVIFLESFKVSHDNNYVRQHVFSTTCIVMYSMFAVKEGKNTSDEEGGLSLKCSIFDSSHPMLRVLIRVCH
jgi:hypothetical protein